jgi:hypothetical protein
MNLSIQSRISHPRARIARGTFRANGRAPLLPRKDIVCRAEEKERADPRAGRSTYRPESYTEIVEDATKAIVAALGDKVPRMEVEFPSVANVSGYAGSSDLFIDSSIQLSISMARKLHGTTGSRVHIVLPDGPEYNRAYKLFKAALDASDGVSLGHLREGKKNTFLSSLAVSFSMTGETPPDSAESAKTADVFVCVNASTVELPELETYANEVRFLA